MTVKIYVEGGGPNGGDSACRQGFKRLFEKCGFVGRLPRVMPCGSRNEAYDDFRNALARAARDDIIMLLVDSEDPVPDINRTWNHLHQRDNWQRPPGADDEDVLFMTTSMETWIVADHDALREHFGRNLQVNALPAMDNLEHRGRDDVLTGLQRATRNCPGPYSKGPRSFVILGKLNPDVLEQRLPSFRRAQRILNNRLPQR